jgi:hypothetical protein
MVDSRSEKSFFDAVFFRIGFSIMYFHMMQKFLWLDYRFEKLKKIRKNWKKSTPREVISKAKKIFEKNHVKWDC